MSLKTNSTNLQEILTTINNLPSAGGDITLPSLSNPASASDILSGKEAIDANGSKVTGTIVSKTAETYTPSTSNQTIASGQYLSGVQTIKGDSNLKAANIKSGTSIFGVTGTYGASANIPTCTLKITYAGSFTVFYTTVKNNILSTSAKSAGSSFTATVPCNSLIAVYANYSNFFTLAEADGCKIIDSLRPNLIKITAAENSTATAKFTD